MKRALIVATAALGLFAAVPASAQTATVTPTSPGATRALTIAPEARTVIRQRLTTARPVQLQGRITVGATVPSSGELVEVPETVVTEVPTVRSYRYFRWNDDVVLVDPSTRRVVQIID